MGLGWGSGGGGLWRWKDDVTLRPPLIVVDALSGRAGGLHELPRCRCIEGKAKEVKKLGSPNEPGILWGTRPVSLLQLPFVSSSRFFWGFSPTRPRDSHRPTPILSLSLIFAISFHPSRPPLCVSRLITVEVSVLRHNEDMGSFVGRHRERSSCCCFWYTKRWRSTFSV